MYGRGEQALLDVGFADPLSGLVMTRLVAIFGGDCGAFSDHSTIAGYRFWEQRHAGCRQGIENDAVAEGWPGSLKRFLFA